MFGQLICKDFEAIHTYIRLKTLKSTGTIPFLFMNAQMCYVSSDALGTFSEGCADSGVWEPTGEPGRFSSERAQGCCPAPRALAEPSLRHLRQSPPYTVHALQVLRGLWMY